jgi:3-oxoacyl-[acyl-carrier protein] reductase
MTDSKQTVVVTGVASGIGKATALRFAADGHKVYGGDIECSDSAAAELQAAGISYIHCDDSIVEQLESLIAAAIDATSRLDVLVNNAGVGMVKQIDDVTEADWQNVFDVNVKAAFFGSRRAIMQMRQQASGGAIINIASNAGILPRSHDPLYSISKMAVVSLTKSLALCHSKDRVRINCVCPGPVEHTRMIEENFEGRDDRQQVVRELISASPLARAWGRMISPAEVAESVYYLASDAARMVSGTAITIDGGKSLGVPPAANS